MLELVAEAGCGYVADAHRGPPARRPRAAPATATRSSTSSAGSRSASRRRSRAAWTRSRSRSTPGSTSTSPSTTTSRSCAGSSELRALGRPLFVSLSRKDFLGAVLAGSWEERRRPPSASGRPPRRRARGRVRGAEVMRLHDAERARRDASRRPDRAWLAAPAPRRRAGRSRRAWAKVIEPGREDGRLVGPGLRGRAPARSSPTIPESLDPGSPRPCAGRDRGALLAPARGARGGRATATS